MRYTLLNGCLFCSAFASKDFLYVIRRKVRLKNIFNLCPTSFFCLLHFVLLSVFVLTSPRKTNYLFIIYGHLQAVLRECFAKVFYPLTIIGKLRAVCWGISQKFYKKNCREIFPTTTYKKDVRYKSNFLSSYDL